MDMSFLTSVKKGGKGSKGGKGGEGEAAPLLGADSEDFFKEVSEQLKFLDLEEKEPEQKEHEHKKTEQKKTEQKKTQGGEEKKSIYKPEDESLFRSEQPKEPPQQLPEEFVFFGEEAEEGEKEKGASAKARAKPAKGRAKKAGGGEKKEVKLKAVKPIKPSGDLELQKCKRMCYRYLQHPRFAAYLQKMGFASDKIAKSVDLEEVQEELQEIKNNICGNYLEKSVEGVVISGVGIMERKGKSMGWNLDGFTQNLLSSEPFRDTLAEVTIEVTGDGAYTSPYLRLAFIIGSNAAAYSAMKDELTRLRAQVQVQAQAQTQSNIKPEAREEKYANDLKSSF